MRRGIWGGGSSWRTGGEVYDSWELNCVDPVTCMRLPFWTDVPDLV